MIGWLVVGVLVGASLALLAHGHAEARIARVRRAALRDPETQRRAVLHAVRGDQ